MSARRTKTVQGYVNFPVNDISSTQEGGMSVFLVVLDEGDVPCCVPQAHMMMGESYLRDDLRVPPKGYTQEELDEAEKRKEVGKLLDDEQKARDEYEEFHYPQLNKRDKERANKKILSKCSEHIYQKYMSRPYAAAVRMGATGWSGYTDKEGYWHCTYNDLTAEGKALYDNLKKLYPDSTLLLQTWLDT